MDYQIALHFMVLLENKTDWINNCKDIQHEQNSLLLLSEIMYENIFYTNRIKWTHIHVTLDMTHL